MLCSSPLTAEKIDHRMSPAHVLEPTYDAIKRHLMDGGWNMGAKLEAVKLADDFGVSITPVRDSLNRLFGEHLVDFIPGEGFRVPVLAEAQLRDLLGLQSILLLSAVQSKQVATAATILDGMPIADLAGALFLRLAGRSANAALIATVASINDRLHLPRSIETEIFEDAECEIMEIANAAKAGSSARALLRGLIPRYFERRIERAALYLLHLSARQIAPT